MLPNINELPYENIFISGSIISIILKSCVWSFFCMNVGGVGAMLGQKKHNGNHNITQPLTLAMNTVLIISHDAYDGFIMKTEFVVKSRYQHKTEKEKLRFHLMVCCKILLELKALMSLLSNVFAIPTCETRLQVACC